MLTLNNLSGFGVTGAAAVAGPFGFTYLGRFSFTVSGAATATATITGFTADDPTKQLLIAFPSEGGVPRTLSVDGTAAGRISMDDFAFTGMFGLAYPTAGAGAVSMTLENPTLETNQISVWEIINANEYYRWASHQFIDNATTAALVAQTRIGNGAFQLGHSVNATDTLTVTWTNLTEVDDVDAGSSRVSTASAAAVGAVTDRDVTATQSAATGQCAIHTIAPLPSGDTLPTVIKDIPLLNATASGSTFVYSADHYTDGTGKGDYKLVAILMYEINTVTVTGVTYGGAAMTSVGSIQNTATANPDLMIAVHEFAVTQAGTHSGTITWTMSGSVAGQSAVFYLFRVYNTTGAATFTSAQGSATGAAVNANINANGVAILAHIRGTATQTITFTGADILSSASVAASAFRVACAIHEFSAAETPRTFQPVGSLSGTYCSCSIVYNP